MVTFKLIEKTTEKIVYHYYPEGKEDCAFGIISIDIVLGKIECTKLADDDFESIIKKEELNSLRDAINKMRIEDGEKALTNDELPFAAHDKVSRYYADHAINKIWDAYKNGKILDKGTVAWY